MPSLTAETLWDIPRVGAPLPVMGGRFIVPVTSHPPQGETSTRLWLVDPVEESRRPFATGPLSEPAVTSDGTTLAYLREVDGHKQVLIQPVDGGEGRQVADLPLGAVGVKWLPDGRIVALARLSAETPTLEETRHRRPEAGPEVHATEAAVFRHWDMWLEHVYHPVVIDPEDGTLLDLTPGWTRFWRWPNTGTPIDDLDAAPDGSRLVFAADDSAPPHRLASWSLFSVSVEGGDPIRLDPERPGHVRRPRFGPGGELVFGYQPEPDYYASPVQLILRRPGDGRERRLVPDWDRSPDAWEWMPDGSLVVAAEDRGRSRLFRLDPREPLPQALTEDGWSTSPIVDRGPSGNGSVYYLSHSLEAPPEVHSLGRGRLTDFTKPATESLELGSVREETFPGADGDPVQIWLVDPPGVDPSEPLPLVHLIHGGPHSSFGDAWHWRWCAQVVAGAGYRVAMVNFHGSTGWGDAFTRSIHGAWGDLPYRDIGAATDHLIDKGLADPERVAVTGGSYGGYLTAWITSQTDRYACAVTHAAVTDLGGMYGSDSTYGLARAFGAEVWDDRGRVERWSPAAHAGGYATPTLVMHGRNDYRVPDSQGLALYGVLVAKGVPARLVFFPGENHWILSRHNSIRWYGEYLDWLRRWL